MIDAQQRSRMEGHNQRAANAAEDTRDRIEQVVAAMETQVELSRASQATAERSEKFARGMAWWSLAVAIASAAAATAAVIIAVGG